MCSAVFSVFVWLATFDIGNSGDPVTPAFLTSFELPAYFPNHELTYLNIANFHLINRCYQGNLIACILV